MKTLMATAIISALGLSAGAALGAPGSDVATVISSTPVVQRIATPRRECWTEQQTAYQDQRVQGPVREEYVEPKSGIGAGTVLGAVIGGVVGHQFGGSSGGRDRGAGVGAIVGGLIGNDIEKNSDAGPRRVVTEQVESVPVTRDVRRCRTVQDTREETVGYDVRYEYHGREYTTRMDYDPGPTMAVNVDVRPARQAPSPSYRY